jgi:predicted nucleotidyltransferase
MAKFKVDISIDEVAEFCRRHRIQRLAVFGSVLGEDFGPNSDVDVLVDFEPEARVGFIALSQMQRELSAMFDRPVDLVPRAGLKPAIRETVLTSAETLYAT